jgi:hypothetical protein
MNKYCFLLGALVLATLLALGPGVTFAEPARNAGIWDWRDHEPVPSEVQKTEQAAGILPTPEQRQAEDRELESLYRSLIKAPRPNPSQSAQSAPLHPPTNKWIAKASPLLGCGASPAFCLPSSDCPV